MKTTFSSAFGSIAHWDDSERDAFKRGQWKVDCPQIELRSRDDGAPITYSGPGVLFQDEEHQLRAKIYGYQTSKKSVIGQTTDELRTGELIPEKHFFDLVALDEKGREWNSERHLLNQLSQLAGHNPIIELVVGELWCEQDLTEGRKPKEHPEYSLNFTVFGDLGFVGNAHIKNEISLDDELRSGQSWLYWKFDAAGCDFELILYPTHTAINVDSLLNDSFAGQKDFPDRVLDALFWVLGKPIYPATRLLQQNDVLRRTIYSRRTLFPEARHRGPFPYQNTEVHAALADAYLRFALVHDNPRFLWAQINAVYESSAARFTDAWALTLSVVIESFVNSEFKDIAEPTDLERAWVDEALKHLGEWEAPARFDEFADRFKERAKGSLSGIKSARVDDRLRALEQSGAITIGLTKAWKDIRNGTAHNYQNTSSDGKFRSNLYALQLLFNQVLFHAIGYRGPYCDFTAPEWPAKIYPDDIAK